MKQRSHWVYSDQMIASMLKRTIFSTYINPAVNRSEVLPETDLVHNIRTAPTTILFVSLMENNMFFYTRK